MTSDRIRLVALMTHPVQYLAPWFRHIHAHAETIDFTVVYATEATPQQQGVGFGHAFEWDVPLREGYSSVVVQKSVDRGSLDSEQFFGLDVPEVVDVIRSLNPDVVLIGGWHSGTQVRAIRALHRAGIPLLYRGDSHLGTMSVRFPRLSRWRARWMLGHFSGYLAVGTRSREYLLAMGVPEPAIAASPHAIDNDAFRARARAARARRREIREQFGFTNDERVVLYAGKLAAIKRPADVIDAVALIDQGAALFVGDGSERDAIENKARAAGVRCIFAGFMNQQQIAEAYVAADALLVPGRETWGLVVNEALACGTPVVMSTDVGAASDLSQPGISVSVPNGPSHFARALAEVIDRRRGGDSTQTDCESLVGQCSFAAATRGLVDAVSFAHRNRRAIADAPARVVALCGNFVFAGGMERNTFEALSAIRRGGADVHVLLNGWSSRPIAELAERVDVTWQVGHYDAPLDGVFRHPLRLLRALADVTMASAQVGGLIWKRQLTHVFVADFRAVLQHAPVLALCRLSGMPVVLRSGVAPTPTSLHHRLWRWLIGPLVTYHVPNSAYIARELRAVGIAAKRITQISNIPPRRAAVRTVQTRQPGRVAYVGQVIPEKGVLELLDAVGLLAREGYDVSLDIAGQMDGWAPDALHGYRHQLRERAGQPDLKGRVRFLGWLEDVGEVLQAASVHCCPSQPAQREGFGTTVIEAKLAGIPSVVSPCGGLPELIDHQRDGWITSDYDAVAIAEGLRWFLSDATRLAVAQDAAKESSKRFDPVLFEQRWQERFDIGSKASGASNARTRLADVRGGAR